MKYSFYLCIGAVILCTPPTMAQTKPAGQAKFDPNTPITLTLGEFQQKISVMVQADRAIQKIQEQAAKATAAIDEKLAKQIAAHARSGSVAGVIRTPH